MKINEIEKHFKNLLINSISNELTTLEGILLHHQGKGSLNCIDDGTGKMIICSVNPEVAKLIKETPEKSKIQVTGNVERTEFEILGLRVECFRVLSS